MQQKAEKGFQHRSSLYHGLQVFKSILWKKWIPAIFYDFKHGPVEERVHQGDGIKCGQSLKRNKEDALVNHMLDFIQPYRQEQFSDRKISLLKKESLFLTSIELVMLRHSSMPGMSSWITRRSLHLTIMLPTDPTNLKEKLEFNPWCNAPNTQESLLTK